MVQFYGKKGRSVCKKLLCKSVLSLALGLSANAFLCVKSAEASQDLRGKTLGFLFPGFLLIKRVFRKGMELPPLSPYLFLLIFALGRKGKEENPERRAGFEILKLLCRPSSSGSSR